MRGINNGAVSKDELLTKAYEDEELYATAVEAVCNKASEVMGGPNSPEYNAFIGSPAYEADIEAELLSNL